MKSCKHLEYRARKSTKSRRFFCIYSFDLVYKICIHFWISSVAFLHMLYWKTMRTNYSKWEFDFQILTLFRIVGMCCLYAMMMRAIEFCEKNIRKRISWLQNLIISLLQLLKAKIIDLNYKIRKRKTFCSISPQNLRFRREIGDFHAVWVVLLNVNNSSDVLKTADKISCFFIFEIWMHCYRIEFRIGSSISQMAMCLQLVFTSCFYLE